MMQPRLKKTKERDELFEEDQLQKQETKPRRR